MFEDQPLIAGENQGLGCPLFDALPHRHIVAGDKHIIELPEAMKSLGIYTVNVNLATGVVGKVKVWVVRE